MSRCCPHPDEEHHDVETCQTVIHYPSEDYPCVCEGFQGDEGTCAECQHKRESHLVRRVCKQCFECSGDVSR